MILTTTQTLIIVGLMFLSTVITRFFPFIVFRNKKGKNSYIDYLGSVLPYATMGMLVVYCLKEVNIASTPFALPEAIAILSIIIVHYLKDNTLLSIGVGTAVYMLLVQFVFI